MNCRRVLFVTSSYPRWEGDSTTPFILHLARDLGELGWDVEVLAPHAPGARTSEVLHEIPVHRFRYFWPESAQTVCYQGGALMNLRRNPLNHAKLPALILSQWVTLMRRVRAGRFNLVHSHWLLPQGFTAALVARRAGVPHVATIHGSDIFALNGAVPAAFKRYAIRHADAITANSSASQEAALRLMPEASHVVRIPMGASVGAVDDDFVADLRKRHRRPGGPLLLFVGRLIEQKGAADLLAAVSTLIHQLSDVTALIVGDGPEMPRLERLATELGIADRVSFGGWIDASRLANYYRAADIFVGPSKRAASGSVEAQGLTFAEAMLAGTPVIATRSGGIVDFVRDRQTGLLVNESAPDEIARAVAELNGDVTLAGHLRDQALAFARGTLTREASARAFSNVYREVLASAAHAAKRGAGK